MGTDERRPPRREDFSRTTIIERSELESTAFSAMVEHRLQRSLTKLLILKHPDLTTKEASLEVERIDQNTKDFVRKQIIQDEGEFLRHVANLQEENARMKRDSHTHSLTNLANHKQATTTFEIARKQSDFLAGKNNLVLVRFDLDGFKRINDNFGHHAGDETLKNVADKLRLALARLRPTDLPIHFSGDEFGLILTDINSGKNSDGSNKTIAETVEMIISRLISEIEKIELPNGKKLTASAGFKIISKDSTGNFDFLDNQADAAAAIAKGCKFVPGLEQGSARIANYDEPKENFLKRKNISPEQYSNSKTLGDFTRTVDNQFPTEEYPDGVPEDVLKLTRQLVAAISKSKSK